MCFDPVGEDPIPMARRKVGIGTYDTSSSWIRIRLQHGIYISTSIDWRAAHSWPWI